MKKLLTLLLLSPLAFAEDDLPSVLYCSLGASQAEFHFNDNGEHWFKIDGASKSLADRNTIKQLKVSPRIISFKQKGIYSINRMTGGIVSAYGSGQCSTSPPNQKQKF